MAGAPKSLASLISGYEADEPEPEAEGPEAEDPEQAHSEMAAEVVDLLDDSLNQGLPVEERYEAFKQAIAICQGSG